MAKWGAKTVRCEHAVDQKIDDATTHNLRIGDAFEGLKWLLARSPGLGVGRTDIETGERIYVVGADELAETPEIWVLYTDTENEIHIWDVNVARDE